MNGRMMDGGWKSGSGSDLRQRRRRGLGSHLQVHRTPELLGSAPLLLWLLRFQPEIITLASAEASVLGWAGNPTPLSFFSRWNKEVGGGA